MAKIRVYELAKKLNMTNKVLLSKLKAMNIDVKSHMSSLEDNVVAKIKQNLFGRKKAQSEVRVKSSVIRRRKQKDIVPSSGDESGDMEKQPAAEKSVQLKADAASMDSAVRNKGESEPDKISGHKIVSESKSVKKESEKKDKSSIKTDVDNAIKDDDSCGKTETDGIPSDHLDSEGKSADDIKPVESAKKIKPSKSGQAAKIIKPAKIVKPAKIIKPAQDALSSVSPKIEKDSELKTDEKSESSAPISPQEDKSGDKMPHPNDVASEESSKNVAGVELEEDSSAPVKGETHLKSEKVQDRKKAEKIESVEKISDGAPLESVSESKAENIKKSEEKQLETTKVSSMPESGIVGEPDKVKAEVDKQGKEDSSTKSKKASTAGGDEGKNPLTKGSRKESRDTEIKKKRRKKKKLAKKSTPAKIIRMAVPIPTAPHADKKEKPAQGKGSKRETGSDRHSRASAKSTSSYKPDKDKALLHPGPIPIADPLSEPKAVRKKDKRKKDHGFADSDEFVGKKKRLKKRKSIVEGKDLYENKRGGKRGRKKDSKAKKNKIQSTVITTPKAIKRRIKVDETIELAEFAKRMGIKANEMIQKLMTLGVMVTLNQTIDFDTAALVASEFGFEVEKAAFEEDILIHAHDTENDAGEQITRPPVVTIMGHVDHGKTSLLDVIRKSKITTGEAGGITQHIGAYSVKTENGTITFLDTPGHAAFTSMRARGAQITDIVVLVVAADDGVMPQTIEAINHSKDAGVPVVVAINKIDKPDADPERVTRELAEHGIVSEDWGGDVIFVEVSAKAGTGIDTLLEMILLQSEVLELKANPNRLAKGHVVEARLDAGRGPIATIIVEQGTLKSGQPVVCGLHAGKIRMMIDDTGASIKEAGPSTPVEIIGLNGVPKAGDEFVALDSEKDAKQISLHRMQKQRSKELAKKSRANLEKLFASMGADKAQELNLIIKADVNGSIEALNDSLMKLAKEEVNIKIVHSGTGTINESDVSLAVVSHAIIIGFNVRPGSQVREMAKKENVDMRFYNIIYDVINDIEAAINGLMPSVFHEIIIGRAEVRDTFVIPNKGTIAGSFVTEGKVVRGEKIRLLRDGVVKCDSTLSSLRRFKDDVKEVSQGYECGISLEKYNDIKIGDVFECYKMEEKKPEMESVKE